MLKLNLNTASLPEYTMTLPISSMLVKYRPFVVKEEKVLLIALQSNNPNQVNDAIRNILLACTDAKLDTKKVCAADAEYAFLQVRCKSIGEEVKPKVSCTKCDTAITVKIKLDEITVAEKDKPKTDPNIKLSDRLSVVMRHPSIHDLDHSLTQVDMAVEMCKRCIESVILDEQVHMASDISQEEVSEFVENMLPNQFEKLISFFSAAPELKYQFSYKCPGCGKKVGLEVSKVADFFP